MNRRCEHDVDIECRCDTLMVHNQPYPPLRDMAYRNKYDSVIEV